MNLSAKRACRLICGLVSFGLAVTCVGQDTKPGDPVYRGLLGKDSPKIKREGDKTYLWAGKHARTGVVQWYDFSGSPIPPDRLQFGIGKDRIRAIDQPEFVRPDDPRLARLPASPYRPEERPKSTDDIMVIGWTDGGEVRAYPTALLDRHELVNDRVGGKPVTVGW